MKKQAVFLVCALLIITLLSAGCEFVNLPFINANEESVGGQSGTAGGEFVDEAVEGETLEATLDENVTRREDPDGALSIEEYKQEMLSIHSSMGAYFDYVQAGVNQADLDSDFSGTVQDIGEETESWSITISDLLEKASSLDPPKEAESTHSEVLDYYREVEGISVRMAGVFGYIAELMEVFDNVAVRMAQIEASLSEGDDLTAVFDLIIGFMEVANEMKYDLEHMSPPKDLEEFHQKLVGAFDQTVSAVGDVSKGLFGEDFISVVFALMEFLNYQVEMQVALERPIEELSDEISVLKGRHDELGQKLGSL